MIDQLQCRRTFVFLFYILAWARATIFHDELVISTPSPRISGLSIAQFSRPVHTGDLKTHSKTFNRRSNIECAVECSKDKNCTAFHFNLTQKECVLASSDNTLGETLVHTAWLFNRVQGNGGVGVDNHNPPVASYRDDTVTSDSIDTVNNANNTMSNRSETITNAYSDRYTTGNSDSSIKAQMNNSTSIGFSVTTSRTTRQTNTGQNGQTDTGQNGQTNTGQNGPPYGWKGVWYGHNWPECFHNFEQYKYIPSLTKCISVHAEMVTWEVALCNCQKKSSKLLDFGSIEDFMTFRQIVLSDSNLNRSDWHIGLLWYNTSGSGKWVNSETVVPYDQSMWAQNKLEVGSSSVAVHPTGTSGWQDQEAMSPQQHTDRSWQKQTPMYPQQLTHASWQQQQQQAVYPQQWHMCPWPHGGVTASPRNNLDSQQPSHGYIKGSDTYLMSVESCQSSTTRSYICQV